MSTLLFDKYLETTEQVDPIKCVGHVVKVQGLLIESRGPQAIIGELCRIEVPKGSGIVQAEVVGLREDIIQLMAYGDIEGIEIGSRVIASGMRLKIPVSKKLLGRVLDCMGRPLDDKGEIASRIHYSATALPPEPLKRRRVTQRIVTGVRAIDGLLSVGRGQRLGIFAGSGVGKSTLLGMVARNTNADVNVVALIGERGREVNDFIAKDLGPEGLAKTVLVVSPSNSPPLARLRGAYTATAVAEYFRDQGLDVMLLFDSITRFARAQREIGLATGEPPATRGYTPSVFDSMPKLLERCGTSDKGTITGFYTILVDGDDMDEPVSDTVRGILDGHIVLSRRLAEAFHYPAVDVLGSISRLAPAVTGPVTQRAAGYIRRLMAVYNEAEDLINVGAYHQGTNPAIDEAIAKKAAIDSFLIQGVEEKSSIVETLQVMGEIAGMEIPMEEMQAWQKGTLSILADDSYEDAVDADAAEIDEEDDKKNPETSEEQELSKEPEQAEPETTEKTGAAALETL
ncbi:MAG: FliI/YscN family ATPase [Spirochaetaceae bacterium]|nr:FliI/YscN family ATPase [Spirochaetaceae bacterium]